MQAYHADVTATMIVDCIAMAAESYTTLGRLQFSL